ncbi:hypothetical protein M8J77_017225 [Diaphorina citri]|nr:hypothetical protein M8J77_017225 [Diaphorina citri]
MSLQWTLIATVLYFEMAFMLLLILPILSTQRLHKILKSKFVLGLKTQAGWYFGCILVILSLFFLDAIREMRKYASPEVKEAHGHLDAEMQNNMKLFRAQRNFYISGFSLFLWLVIRQIIQLIAQQANLLAQNEASMNQARQAAVAAQALLDSPREGDSDEIKRLKEKLSKTEEELKKEKTNSAALKSQADSVGKEYDRLLKEHEKVQKVVTEQGDKKDE